MKLFQSTYLPEFVIGCYTFNVANIVLERFERSIPKHSHSKNSYELHYISSGYGYAAIDGINYDIVPNTFYITGPFVEHEQISFEPDPMCEYCIYLKVTDKHKKSANVMSDASQLAEEFLSMHFRFGQDTQHMHELLNKILFELEHRYTGYESQVRSLLIQLIVASVRNFDQRLRLHAGHAAISSYDSQYLIIEECFLYEYSVITLDVLADRLHLGRRQTERILKQHYGKTFLQKRNESRMSAAVLLLNDKSKSISEIADILGYSTIEHFSAAFRRYYGICASDWRTRPIE